MGEHFPHPVYGEIQPHQQPYPLSHRNGDFANDVAVANAEDEPYTIKCICGFDDDAADTVFCEQCNTWQHIPCYYSPETILGVDAVHSCVDCNPHQNLDRSAAIQHQRWLRQPHGTGDDRKSKKTTQRSHKRSKARDANNNAIQVNGWTPHDANIASPANGSPRDSQPPAKRPKTTHKPSGSVTNGHSRQANSRHRGASESLATIDSQVNPPPKLPLNQCPPDFLSPHFIRVHRENTNYNLVQANIHSNITVASLLVTWLEQEEVLAEATNGKTRSEVFQHFPRPIEELDIPIQRRVHTEPHVQFHGANPQWPYLTVERDVIAGSYVGELRGCIGLREDYQSDPANQWDKLRHPNHFVFFHPDLPIYIDSRQEGTLLRYVRRSCQPNIVMKTIITGPREYRFCFTAIADIPQGAEITISWDTQYDAHLQNVLSKGKANMSEDEISYAYEWVSTNLAHFGGCACENQYPDGPCLLAHWDRRAFKYLPDGTPAESKSRKKAVSKKLVARQTSNGTNSRESSPEAAQGVHEGDLHMADDRSTTLSSKSSRDTTPHTNNDLSEREKRKITQIQRLIDQVEDKKAHTSGKKKKRDSGSNAHTPNLASQRQSSRPEPNNSHPPTPVSGSSSAFAASKNSPKIQCPSAAYPGRSRPTPHEPRILRPTYSDASTQTVPPAAKRACVAPRKIQFLSRSQSLLRRSLLRTQLQNRTKSACSLSPEEVPLSQSPENSQMMDIESTSTDSPEDPQQDAEVKDVVMADFGSAAPSISETMLPKKSIEDLTASLELTQDPELPNHPPIKPPAPPWPASLEMEFPAEQSSASSHTLPMYADEKTTDFVKPPLPQLSTSHAANATSEPTIQSPPVPVLSSNPPMATISNSSNAETSSITRPSPVKKKMSLSDYMKSKRKQESASDKPVSAGTPPSIASPAGLSEENRTTSIEAERVS